MMVTYLYYHVIAVAGTTGYNYCRRTFLGTALMLRQWLNSCSTVQGVGTWEGGVASVGVGQILSPLIAIIIMRYYFSWLYSHGWIS